MKAVTSSVLCISSIFAAFFTSQVLAISDDVINSCDVCHGTGGVSQNTKIPTIAGIPEWNISDQMLQYLDGRHASTVNHIKGDTSKQGNMKSVVDGLTEAQIEKLAQYYSKLTFVRTKQSSDPAKAAKGKEIHMASCDKCHSDGGGNSLDEASILAGQQKGYLLDSINQYKNGQRTGDKGMVDKIKPLSGDDIAALVEYYASY